MCSLSSYTNLFVYHAKSARSVWDWVLQVMCLTSLCVAVVVDNPSWHKYDEVGVSAAVVRS